MSRFTARASAIGVLLVLALLAACASSPTTDTTAASEGEQFPVTAALRPSLRTTTTAEVVPTTTIPTTIPTTTTTAPVVSSAGFQHPGVLIDSEQISTVRARIAAGQEPWASALKKAQSSGGSIATANRKAYTYGSLSYVPWPVPVVQAPSAGTKLYIAAHPELGLAAIGDVEHLDDARAAYTHALLWTYTGNSAHAQKAIEIMNAWSYTLQEIKFDQPRRIDNNSQVYANGKLQASWGAELFTRAAELVRYSAAGWSAADVAQFERMLTNVYLPLTITGWRSGANWLMSSAEATINIGVFTNDRAAFDGGVAMWRRLAPTTIYMPSDGPLPLPPHRDFDTAAEINWLWYNPSQYLPGLQGETLRDLSHMAMGLGALTNGAETARIQGVDLYGEQRDRILSAFELNAGYVREYLQERDRLGANPPSTWRPSNWVGSSFNLGGMAYMQGWEVAYSHYDRRLGYSMPNTKWVVERLRPSGTALHLSWETLTHAR
ncbi:MAG TPA: alginate lyase family protein [Microthrixaceae bacterium]|nr:alginate lyase family protein [Microthrixaceae bacterium]